MCEWTENQILITCHEQAEQAAANELRAISPEPPARLIQWMGPGVGLFETGLPAPAFLRQLHTAPPVFIRHFFPVQCRMDALDPGPETRAALQALAGRFDASHPAVLQARSLTDRTVGPLYDLACEAIQQAGVKLDARGAEQVLSMVRSGDQVFAGVSLRKENLSGWPGGNCRYAKTEQTISRAEYKLMEAIETFSIKIAPGAVAVDLGAAPGGWSRVLRQHGAAVYAVDPASLDERLRSDPDIVHFRMTAQKFFAQPPLPQFDLLVNDMKMDVSESVHILLSCRTYLAAGGLCVATLKLPQNGWQSKTARALERLSKEYHIAHARQLYHNRSEVTVVLRG